MLIVRPPDGPDRHRDIIMIDGSDPNFIWEPNSVPTAKQVADIYVRTALVIGSGKKVPDQATLVPVLDALAPGVPLSPAVWTTRSPETGPRESAAILAQTLEDLRRARQIACSSQPPTPQRPLKIGDAPAWVTVDQLVNNGILRMHRAPTIKHSEFVDNGIPVLTVTSVTQLNGRAGGHLNPDDPRINRTRLTEPGDVIFATIGAKAVVDQEGGHILAGHVVAIEILDPNVITPEVLATYLSTDAVANLSTGVTIQRVNPRQASVPLLPPHQARNITTTLTRLRRQRADIVAWLETINATQQALVDAAAAGVQIGDDDIDATTPAEDGARNECDRAGYARTPQRGPRWCRPHHHHRLHRNRPGCRRRHIGRSGPGHCPHRLLRLGANAVTLTTATVDAQVLSDTVDLADRVDSTVRNAVAEISSTTGALLDEKHGNLPVALRQFTNELDGLLGKGFDPDSKASIIGKIESVVHGAVTAQVVRMERMLDPGIPTAISVVSQMPSGGPCEPRHQPWRSKSVN